VLGIALLATRTQVDSYDGSIMLQVATNAVNHHSLHVVSDYFGLNTPYSAYGLGMSLLMVPAVLLGNQTGRDPAIFAAVTEPGPPRSA